MLDLTTTATKNFSPLDSMTAPNRSEKNLARTKRKTIDT